MAKSYARIQFDKILRRALDYSFNDALIDNDLTTVRLEYYRKNGAENAVNTLNTYGIPAIMGSYRIEPFNDLRHVVLAELPTVFDYAQLSYTSNAFDFVWALMDTIRALAGQGYEDYLILAVALIVKYEGSTPIVASVSEKLASMPQ